MGWGEWGELGGKETKTAREGGRGRGASAFETPCDQMQNPSASEAIAAAAAAAAAGWEPRGAPSGAVCLAWWPARRPPARRVRGLGKRAALSDSETLQGCNRRWGGKKGGEKGEGKYGAKVTKSHLLGRIKTDTPAKHTHTHTLTQTHTRSQGEGGGGGRCSRSCSSRGEWLAARLQKCPSAPSLTKRTGYRSVFLGSLPLSPPSPPSSQPPPPAPRPGWERQESGISPLPPSPPPPPHTPLSPRPASPLLPPHPPTHSPARGSRPHRHPQPRGRPPAPLHASRPGVRSPQPGETETEGKKLQLGLRGSGLGRGSWRAGCATRRGALPSTFWPSRCPVLLQFGPREEVK